MEQEGREHEYRAKYIIKEKGGVEKANPLVLCQLLGNLYDMEVRARSHGAQDGSYYLRHPSTYFDKVKARFSLEREEYPGLRALNLAFEDARIPYRIRNKQAAKTKQDPSRDTYWTIEKIPMAKESEHPLQDAPKLTDSQDISDGSCLPSSDIPAG